MERFGVRRLMGTNPIEKKIRKVRSLKSEALLKSSVTNRNQILSRLTVLPRSFYSDRSTLGISHDLLGKYLVRRNEKHLWIGKIVEVEAYIGEKDPACHAWRGLTPRTKIMYGPPAYAYVYFTYGMYFMLNVVTEQEGFPAAVLIRALEPVHGFRKEDPKPASGPGKLCKNMNIDKSLNGISLESKELWIGHITGDLVEFEVRWSQRIGVSGGKEDLWRAYIFGNPFVSRRSNSEDSLIPSPIHAELMREKTRA
jgi:DNA-3-methyladenine glycosylase